MKQKGFSIESLHIIGCLLLVLNSLLFIFPGMTISRPSDVPMTFSVADKIWIFAFPIFAFLLVEEFHHTENFNKLAACILAFAIIFEIPFDLVQSRRPFEINLNNQFFYLVLWGGFVTNPDRRMESGFQVRWDCGAGRSLFCCGL